MANKRYRGGVLASEHYDAFGIAELLTAHLRRTVDLVHYTWPPDIDTHARHDFLMVFSLAELQAVIKVFDYQRREVPLLVHIDEPATLQVIDHRSLFPGVRVLAVPQARLEDDPDITLDLDILGKIDRYLSH
jgi:hypothetical protein